MNPNLNGGKNIAVVEAKMTLAQLCEVTLTFKYFWDCTNLRQKPNCGKDYTNYGGGNL